MQHKTIVSIGGVMMSGLVCVLGLQEACLYEGDIFISPDVVLEAEYSKICFEDEVDYQVFKEKTLLRYHDNANLALPGTIGFFGDPINEWDEFNLMINEETVRGNINLTNIPSENGLQDAFGTRLEQEILSLIDSYDFAYLPDLTEERKPIESTELF